MPVKVIKKHRINETPYHMEKISVVCLYCGKSFDTIYSDYVRGRGKYCSRQCKDNNHTGTSKRKQIFDLYNSGKTYTEISEILNMNKNTVAGNIHVMKIANRCGKEVFRDKNAVINGFHKLGITSCELCGYGRVIEVCHVKEKANGGKYSLDNCLSLCANCHHLFDHKKLTEEELNKLHIIERINWKDGII